MLNIRYRQYGFELSNHENMTLVNSLQLHHCQFIIVKHWQKYSRFVVHSNIALVKANYHPFQLYGKGGNCRDVINVFPPKLDVKVRLGAVTHGGKYIVTAIRQLEEITIKCVEVEVSPCTADLPIMNSTYQKIFRVKLDISLDNEQ